jgi:hypothetical protein
MSVALNHGNGYRCRDEIVITSSPNACIESNEIGGPLVCRVNVITHPLAYTFFVCYHARSL